MKKHILFLFLMPILLSCTHKNTSITEDFETGTGYFKIIFTPDQAKLKPNIDTVIISSNSGIDISAGYPHPMIQDVHNTVLANRTHDTLTAGWIKAVALNDPKNKKYQMKVISLQENNTGEERSYAINVGLGPSFGQLLVTQSTK